MALAASLAREERSAAAHEDALCRCAALAARRGDAAAVAKALAAADCAFAQNASRGCSSHTFQQAALSAGRALHRKARERESGRTARVACALRDRGVYTDL